MFYIDGKSIRYVKEIAKARSDLWHENVNNLVGNVNRPSAGLTGALKVPGTFA